LSLQFKVLSLPFLCEGNIVLIFYRIKKVYEDNISVPTGRNRRTAYRNLYHMTGFYFISKMHHEVQKKNIFNIVTDLINTELGNGATNT
jgi:hypothetical protein